MADREAREAKAVPAGVVEEAQVLSLILFLFLFYQQDQQLGERVAQEEKAVLAVSEGVQEKER